MYQIGSLLLRRKGVHTAFIYTLSCQPFLLSDFGSQRLVKDLESLNQILETSISRGFDVKITRREYIAHAAIQRGHGIHRIRGLE
jgi:hypothetical protein